MKYFLLYKRNQVLKNGDEVRLELHKAYPDDFPLYPIAREIGDVLTGLHLDIEGGMDDIDTPIVKTSLTFSVVDAPELDNNNIKAGDWEEFYTSDATGWKVILLGRRKGESEFRAMWGGFVTPDSYTETLQHHGVVTITARDNIGHLQDFAFDAAGNEAGMITPYELITQAWAKIASPMTLDWRGEEDENEWPQAEGVNAVDMYLNVSAFEGKTWHDAVTETLYSLGLVMRYVGRNKVAVCPLRRLPYQGRAFMDYLESSKPTFVAYGTRELVPAVKEIAEEVAYELGKGADQPLVGVEDFTGEEVTCSASYGNYDGDGIRVNVPVNPIVNNSATGWDNIESSTLFFNPQGYTNALINKYAIEGQMFLAVNVTNNAVWYSVGMTPYDIDLRIDLGPVVCTTPEKNIEFAPPYDTIIKTKSIIKFVQGRNELYYNGTRWDTPYAELELSADTYEDRAFKLFIPAANVSGEGVLEIHITAIEVRFRDVFPTLPTYIGIKALSFSAGDGYALMEKNTITTKYNEENNVRMSRSPELGPAYDEVVFPALIKNGIFRKDGNLYKPAPTWKWNTDEDYDAAQLAVLVHKELLCYHSKANNLLTGDIVNADMIDPRTIWKWKGKEHLLLSGSYNFLSSQLEGASLREFVRYEKMWLPHTDIDVAEVSYTGGSVTVKFIADDRVSWNVTTPEWILPSVRAGSGTADILLFVQSSRIGREGLVQIGPAVVKVIQKAVGDFNTDYNDDFKVFRDFNGDYYIGDIN